MFFDLIQAETLNFSESAGRFAREFIFNANVELKKRIIKTPKRS